MHEELLITGRACQEDTSLTDLLLLKGYRVQGIINRIATKDTEHNLKKIAILKTKLSIT
jgi:GDP-D-mannose dehydratase